MKLNKLQLKLVQHPILDFKKGPSRMTHNSGRGLKTWNEIIDNWPYAILSLSFEKYSACRRNIFCRCPFCVGYIFGGGELIHIPLEYPDFKFKWNGIFAIIPFHLFAGIFTMTFKLKMYYYFFHLFIHLQNVFRISNPIRIHVTKSTSITRKKKMKS